ncbi:MAG: O-antigen ligase-related protein [Candidatus Peregrinibacteria bacterium GW2011_GWF2_33_10]|nr:MAG: O-antigen ligase-related protein [Candidatus Peregrinibacteria bacterium GW2011_GWF2_33_10]OGJ44979.1 MAG: hypothetical protein A2263_02860 [Candidatus Peregrinibacteria bacterium RIFOXYA2_FULL_33_21]OGJ47453.1 MAG: hypothetical protein A2272_04275 [Candidatus Peregrinibacteria bacterium RIFOXYA12_FULL_33_12]
MQNNFVYLIEAKKVLKLALMMFLFLLPFQISDIIYQKPFLGGFSPYLTFSLYINDVIFGVILILFGILWIKEELFLNFDRQNVLFNLIVFLILIVVVQSLLVRIDFFGVLKLSRLFEILLVMLVLNSNILSKNEKRAVYLITIAIQVLIGLLQFTTQGSIGLRVLGESLLNPAMIGVAKLDFLQEKLIRSYGTFPHPNIFGGSCAVAVFFVMQFWREHKFWSLLLMAWFFLGLILSMSRSAMIALSISLIIYTLLRKKIDGEAGGRVIVKPISKWYFSWKILLCGLLLAGSVLFVKNFQIIQERFAFRDLATITERVEQLNISLEMIKKYIFGVGIGNFVPKMQEFSDQALEPWQFQPVHNSFLLLSNELGVLAGILVLVIFIVAVRKLYQQNNFWALSLLLFIFIIANLDHYFYDIYSGQMLLAVVLGQLPLLTPFIKYLFDKA